MEALFKIAPDAAKRTYHVRRGEAAQMLGKHEEEQQGADVKQVRMMRVLQRCCYDACPAALLLLGVD